MDTLRPAQVLDVLAGLVNRHQDLEFARLCAIAYTDWATSNGFLEEDWVGLQEHQLRSASCFHISEDMAVMTEYASRHLEDDDAFTPEMLPRLSGFAYLAEPLQVLDKSNLVIKVRYLQWSVGNVVTASGERVSGLLITHWIDFDDNADTRSMPTHMGKVAPFHVAFLPWHTSVGVLNAHLTRVKEPDWAPHAGATDAMRQALALFMLMDQTVTDKDAQPVTRASTKRAVRAGITPSVTVVDLRRHANSRQPGETLVEWTRRWPVSGHWRRQPYKAPDGSTIVRKIWIAPYIKGPLDKPIVTSDKVYRITR
jgi:hypothetical protein